MRTEISIHKFLIVALLVMLGLVMYGVFTDTYDKSTLKRESRSGYLPDEVAEVEYSDTMKLKGRVWYDGKMWTVIRFE